MLNLLWLLFLFLLDDALVELQGEEDVEEDVYAQLDVLLDVLDLWSKLLKMSV